WWQRSASGTACTSFSSTTTSTAKRRGRRAMAENGRLPDSDLAPTLLGGRLRKDAADSADRLFTRYALDTGDVLQAVSPADTYRSYEQQVQARKNVGNLAAVPGTSNHGWGVAVDFANGMNSWSSAAQD